MDPQKQQLIDYVQKSLAQGFAPDTIRAQLVQSGWPTATIDEVLAAPVPPPQPTVQATLRQPVAQTNTQPKAKTSKKVPLLIGIAVGVLLAVFVGFLLLHIKSSHKAVNSAGLTAAQRNAQDTQRKNDIAQLLAGINAYISDNAGQLPTQVATGAEAHQLTICGADCSAKTVSTATMSYYQNAPTAIEFHPYTKGLTVSDPEKLYIVPAASCNQGALTSGPARSVAILYQSASTGQQCISS